MTDIDKLIAKTKNALCVEETTTKHTYFNIFGEKVKEETSTLSTIYVFDENKIEWVKGITKGDSE